MLFLDRARRAAKTIGGGLRAMFQVDARALAVMRVLLGLLFAYDALDRALYADVFYTDAGVLPRSFALVSTNGLSPSLHMFSGTTEAQVALLVLGAVCALCFAAGFHTKLTGVVSLILALSVTNRNPELYHTADQYGRVLMVWLLLSPCQRYWSLDVLLRRVQPLAAPHAGDEAAPEKDEAARETDDASSGPEATENVSAPSVLSVATVGLFLQVLVVYGQSEYFKSHYIDVWFYDGTMLSYVLQYDHYTSAWGLALRAYPGVLTFLSRASFILEGLGPPVALLAFRFPRIRLAIVASFVAFHLGTAVLMRVGLFPFASIIAWIPFIPSKGWDWLSRAGKRAKTRIQRLRRNADRAHDPKPVPRAPSRLLRWATEASALGLIVNMLWSISFSTKLADDPPPQAMTTVATLIGFTQMWQMFAGPGTDDGWLVIEGKFANGETRDLLTNESVSWARPAVISETVPNDRWRTYLFRMWENEYGDQRKQFGGYLCRLHKQPRLISYRINIIHTRTRVEGGRVVGEHPPEREIRAEANCPRKLSPRVKRGGS